MAPAPQRSSTPDLSSVPTAFSPDTCLRRGLCPVTSLRPQGPDVLESHSLYYELHVPPGIKDQDDVPGEDGKVKSDYKVVFIMGLNSSSFAWGPQVAHFTRPGSKASVLVFDNRGVGNSDYPRGPYTTSGMAEDAICLLDYIGWTKDRELHIVGISLGGMIAQELAYRVPNRIASLVLSVTTPGGYIWQNFPPFAGLSSLTRLLFTPEPVEKIPIILDMLYNPEWLNEKDQEDPTGRTNREVQAEAYVRRVAITKPQLFIGHISQMAAALTHHVSRSRLAKISQQIPKVTIVTGDKDNLVSPHHSLDLKKAMAEAELVQWKDTGHGINHQRPQQFNDLLERTWKEGKAKAQEES